MSQKFVPMAKALDQIAKDCKFTRLGIRRSATVADLIHLTHRERAVLARRLLNREAR